LTFEKAFCQIASRETVFFIKGYFVAIRIRNRGSMKYLTGLALLFLMVSFHCKGLVTGNLLTFETQAPGLLREDVIPYFLDNASYVNGGVTFTYPAGLFSTTPTIRVSLEENATVYSTSQVFVAHITSSSATSVTIRVNLVTTSTISEASNNEVTVHINAIEI